MKKRILGHHAIRRREQQVWQDLGGEYVILNLEAGVYYGLDDVGSRVWELIHSPATVEEIRDTLVAEYDVDPVRCEHDLLRLLQEMFSAGLVLVADGQA